MGEGLIFSFGSTNIAINVTNHTRLLALLSQKLCDHDGFALATLNLDHVTKLNDSDAYRRAYSTHDIVVADGNPIVWLSRIAGRPVDRITGADLIKPLSRIAEQTKVKVALVGGTQASLDKAAAGLVQDFPSLEIVLKISPSYPFDIHSSEADQIYEALKESGAGLCFLALGAPKQELFAARGRFFAPGVGFVSVGAGLDFIAKTQTRAPKWIRQLAMEWAWRLCSDPVRLAPRYLKCAVVLPRQLLAALRLRKQQAPVLAE